MLGVGWLGMSDIVERLRFAGSLPNAPSSQKAEFHGAADEIEELRADNKRLKAFIADRIRDARREEMLMQINYRGDHE